MPLALSAQGNSYLNYSTGEGLPSATVYECMQDSKGFIWFVTEAGISRYDGRRFVNYSTEDGVAVSENFHLFEDSRQRIWFLGINNAASYYFEGKFYGPKTDSLLAQLPGHGYLESIMEDSQGRIWLGSIKGNSYVIDGDKVEKVSFAPPPEEHTSRWISPCEEQEAEAWAIWKDKKKEPFKNIGNYGSVQRFVEYQNQLFLLGFYLQSGSEYPFRVINTKLNKQIPFLSLEEGKLAYSSRYDDFQLISLQNPGPLCTEAFNRLHTYFLSPEPEGGIWLAINDGGAQRYAYRNGTFIPNHPRLFAGKYITHVMKDREGGHWFCTHGDGVFYVPWLNFPTYTHENTSGFPEKSGLHSFQVWGDSLVFPNMYGNLQILHENQVKAWDWLQSSTQQDIRGFWVEGPWLFLASGALLGFHREEGLPLPTPPGMVIPRGQTYHDSRVFKANVGSIKCFLRRRNGDLLIGSSSGFWEARHDSGPLLPADIHFRKVHTGWFRSIYESPEGEIWAGTNEGLIRFEGKGRDSLGMAENIERFRGIPVTVMVGLGAGRLCLGTAGEGLFVQNGEDYFHIGRKDGLSGTNCEAIAADGPHTVWVGTNKGLNRIHFQPGDPEQYSIRVITANEGLLNNEVRDLKIPGDSVWVCSKQGFTLIRKSQLDTESYLPPVYITGVSIEGKEQALEAEYTLPSHRSEVNVSLSGLSYRSTGKIRYKYRIPEQDTSWHYTDVPSLLFSSLPLGLNTLEVKARSIAGNWSARPGVVRFNVPIPFSRTFTFNLLMILGLSGLLSGLLFLRASRIRKREKLRLAFERKLIDLEQKALRARMNPHFIFNCLNTIQGYIIQNDKHAAYQFIEKFGLLIRKIVDHSGEKLVKLEEDLNALELYIQLEQMRFEGQFTYEMSIEAGMVPGAYQVPSLLLQPIAENAILHGLLPLEGEGKLAIRISRQGDMLRILIEDNGIGRARSAQLNAGRRRAHNSVGLKITRERIELMGHQGSKKGGLYIHDLEAGGKAAGTQVEILLPVAYSMVPDPGKSF